MVEEVTSTNEEKETLARAHLPFRAEYCKTSRAACKKCGEPMLKDTLKLAFLTKSRFHDGHDATFNHVTCFFQIKRPTSVAEIRNFETLKYEDQKILEEAIESNGLSVLGSTVKIDTVKTKGSKKEKSKKSSSKKRETEELPGLLVNYDDYLVEYAKSSRSTCIKCEKKIEKGLVRLGKLDYAAETAWRGGPVPRWYHVDCFVKAQSQLEFFGKVEKIKNFDELEKEDQKILKQTVKPIEPPKEGEAGFKKLKKEESSEEQELENKLLMKQSDRFFALRDFVRSMKNKDIEHMLEYMEQKSSFKASSLLEDMATDILLFGPLSKCPKCKERRGMVLRGGSYICTNGPEDNRCDYETRDPRRTAPDVPEELIEKYPFFKDDYEFREGKRIFPSKFVKAVEQKEAEDNKIVQKDAPLEGLSIGVISWSSVGIDKEKAQKKIITLGGTVRTALDRSLFVILSSEQELEKSSPKVEVAKALNVPFVTANFLFEIKTKDDVVPEVTKCLIGNWEGNLETRLKDMSPKPTQVNTI